MTVQTQRNTQLSRSHTARIEYAIRPPAEPPSSHRAEFPSRSLCKVAFSQNKMLENVCCVVQG